MYLCKLFGCFKILQLLVFVINLLLSSYDKYISCQSPNTKINNFNLIISPTSTKVYIYKVIATLGNQIFHENMRNIIQFTIIFNCYKYHIIIHSFLFFQFIQSD